MRDFSEFMDRMEMVDIPMTGRSFTWSNFQANATQSKLDRFLFSQEFLHKFKVVQWGLPRPISDHCPIMIADDNRDWALSLLGLWICG
ncbi:hypothetical protein RHMOL_Rhmol04G0208000 [Rhododendron molle]|uniref:Uncharacterized protein n=1 Tax=Rhododendron molle TaxID=49168 RepID=A0ACC0P570_RHOML|nr:hypothetical protein RHMOL_Rhmol04G0208000 [Rhododendron molle]